MPLFCSTLGPVRGKTAGSPVLVNIRRNVGPEKGKGMPVDTYACHICKHMYKTHTTSSTN